MSAKEFDPRRLDVAAFAKVGGQLEGDWPLSTFERLTETAVASALPADGGSVGWRARGETRALRGAEAEVWMHLKATTHVPLECQRCLQPVDVPLDVDRGFLFVHGEDAAAQLDADSEDDVLAMTRALDLHELIEDELLLAMPIVPRHDVCPDPLVAPAGLDSPEEASPNPFAALAGLKRSGPVN